MAIPVEFYSVIVPKNVIQEKYQGGLDQYKEDCPNMSYLEDEHLTRVGFMHPKELDEFIDGLTSRGLNFNEEEKRSDDFVIATNLWGLNWEVRWALCSPDGIVTWTT